MVVGVAFSGGGVTAVIATLCALKSLNNVTFDSFSVVSGGSLGLTLYDTVSEDLWVPSYDELQNDTSDVVSNLSKRHTSAENPVWFASLLDYVPDDDSFESLLKVLRDLGILDKIVGKDNWWKLALESVIEKGYKINVTSGSVFKSATYVNFALAKEKSCPLSRSDTTGHLSTSSAQESLYPANLHIDSENNRKSYVRRDESESEIVNKTMTDMDAVAASSSFWNVEMITGSSLDYYTFKGWLEKYDVNKSSGRDVLTYAMDAGVVDSTGITSLLRDKVDSIILFFNDNNDLREMNASFAYLFGIDTSKTNSMNALAGPKNSQVFDSDLYESFILNLTQDPVRAHLRNVKVIANAYYGIESYELKDLFVLSNQYSLSFLNSFADSEDLKSALSSKFPNKFSVGMSTLDANMLCLFNQWKVREYGVEIANLFTNQY